MNTKRVDALLEKAMETIDDAMPEYSIFTKDTKSINGSYRSAISSFGAAITLGSFKAAVAFFSQDADSGKSGIQRSRLLSLMYHVLTDEWKAPSEICAEVIGYDRDRERVMKQEFICAAVALKLSMNAFDLKKPKKS